MVSAEGFHAVLPKANCSHHPPAYEHQTMSNPQQTGGCYGPRPPQTEGKATQERAATISIPCILWRDGVGHNAITTGNEHHFSFWS